MADFGIGETIALSAAIGAGSAAMKNQDPLRGALIGGVLGGATAGIGSAMSGTDAAITAAETANMGGQQAVNDILGSKITDNALFQLPQGIDQIPAGQSFDPKALDELAARNGVFPEGSPALPGSAPTGQASLPVSPNAPITPNAPNVPKGFFDQSTKTMLGDAPLSTFNKAAATGVAGLVTPMLNTGTASKYGVPAAEHYNGPLNQLHYDPSKYTPTIPNPPNPPYQPSYAGYAGYKGYAEGGITNLATGGSAPLIGTPAQNTTMDSSVGNNAMFPMSEMSRSYYATPTQLPAGINSNNNPNPASPDGSMPGYGPRLNASTGQMMNNFAEGGIAGLLKGRGDGMSDDIHATINDRQPARLADGEFVVPADVVSHLGNGSTDAGAKHLYSMMDKVRKARTGRKSQGKQISAGGYLPA
jgi:hypothetical protein